MHSAPCHVLGGSLGHLISLVVSMLIFIEKNKKIPYLKENKTKNAMSQTQNPMNFP